VFDQLSSAIGGGAMALVRQPKTAGFFQVQIYHTPEANVLNSVSHEVCNERKFLVLDFL